MPATKEEEVGYSIPTFFVLFNTLPFSRNCLPVSVYSPLEVKQSLSRPDWCFRGASPYAVHI